MARVAVIGAGLCGATAAAALSQTGIEVSVFEKGRSAGGRMSSKRSEAGYLDMGAQYFTVRSDMFRRQVTAWLDAGHVALWPCKTASLSESSGVARVVDSPDKQPRFVGTPSMHAPVKAVLAGIPLVANCRIHTLQREQGNWTLVAESGERYRGFTDVVLTMPPVQAQQLLAHSGYPGVFTGGESLLEPCWAVALRSTASACADALFCEHPKLRFVSHQAAKPGRGSCWIVHYSARFSRDNLDQPPEFWYRHAEDIVRTLPGPEAAVERIAAHRWLYASQNPEVEPPGILALPEHRLWLGGDWSFGGRVENAYLAGVELAAAVRQHGMHAR